MAKKKSMITLQVTSGGEAACIAHNTNPSDRNEYVIGTGGDVGDYMLVGQRQVLRVRAGRNRIKGTPQNKGQRPILSHLEQFVETAEEKAGRIKKATAEEEAAIAARPDLPDYVKPPESERTEKPDYGRAHPEWGENMAPPRRRSDRYTLVDRLDRVIGTRQPTTPRRETPRHTAPTATPPPGYEDALTPANYEHELSQLEGPLSAVLIHEPMKGGKQRVAILAEDQNSLEEILTELKGMTTVNGPVTRKTYGPKIGVTIDIADDMTVLFEHAGFEEWSEIYESFGLLGTNLETWRLEYAFQAARLAFE